MTAAKLASLVSKDACRALIIAENLVEAGELAATGAYAFVLGAGWGEVFSAISGSQMGCPMGYCYALTPTTIPREFLRSVQEAYAEEFLRRLLHSVKLYQERAPSRESEILIQLFPSGTGHRVLEGLDTLFGYAFLEEVIDGISDAEHSLKVAEEFSRCLAQEIARRGGTVRLPNELVITHMGNCFLAYQESAL
jgi:hypothetical protein